MLLHSVPHLVICEHKNTSCVNEHAPDSFCAVCSQYMWFGTLSTLTAGCKNIRVVNEAFIVAANFFNMFLFTYIIIKIS